MIATSVQDQRNAALVTADQTHRPKGPVHRRSVLNELLANFQSGANGEITRDIAVIQRDRESADRLGHSETVKWRSGRKDLPRFDETVLDHYWSDQKRGLFL